MIRPGPGGTDGKSRMTMSGPASGEAPGRPPAAWLDEVRRLERDGELFRAYDVALQGLREHPGDLQLQYRAILVLASAGMTSRAVARYEQSDLRGRPEIDFQVLPARLMKDIALLSPPTGRPAKLRAAADRYLEIFRRTSEAAPDKAYFPGINAASLALLAGDRQAARALAREVVSRLMSRPDAEDPYFGIATMVEAHLILGELDRARALIPSALAAAGETPDYRARAATVRQCLRVLDALDHDRDVVEELRPPRVVHYAGHLIAPPGMPGRLVADEETTVSAAIEAELDRAPVGFAYGSLAAGADILFAEALLRRGVKLHVVLPFCIPDFIDVSVLPSGAGWLERFERCLARAEIVQLATDDRYLGDDPLFGYCSQIAMGLTVLRARHLCAATCQILVWDGAMRDGAAGTAADAARWRQAGCGSQIVIPCRGSVRPTAGATAPVTTLAPEPAPAPAPERRTHRSTRAMLFGDVKGFSQLTDAQLPVFVEHVLGTIARVLERHRDSIELVNTWGDGLFVVCPDAAPAARIALELQERMEQVSLETLDLPPTLALRLGGHLGPVYGARDPILNRQNVFGAQVSRAARIEPVTPPGAVYVSDTFAAALALGGTAEFEVDYVGVTALAKNFGDLRMFLLRRNLEQPAT